MWGFSLPFHKNEPAWTSTADTINFLRTWCILEYTATYVKYTKWLTVVLLSILENMKAIGADTVGERIQTILMVR